MKITLNQYDSTFTVEHKRDDLTLTEMQEEMLVPLLLAAGFAPESVASLFGEDAE